MSDSIAEQIANNLVSALNGKSITYGGSAHTITAERQRLMLNINNRYPFVEVGGPWADIQGRDNLSNDTKLRFSIVLYDSTINDSSSSADPISKQLGNVHAELIKLIMADISRGKKALLTEYDNWGTLINLESEIPEACVYLDVTVQAYISATDPYSIGA